MKMTYAVVLLSALSVAAFTTQSFAQQGRSAQANAKGHVTYEQAWKLCRAFLDREGLTSAADQQRQRYQRGGACMAKYGYRF